ncbi:hypothetical protein ARC78_11155 [Stenotrophomonas pictorum JCM 9942]|jgi:membrane associated rhomboid family serine protease|uniref:Peptidase S54 rhomboid domain-containing protein n=2 Tax=Stenotrophomonas pictorum TaxID=86184 RepID=A0A0R0ALF1_9GAMM|nr:rhomboid family intramembrane serine protease [Stenotrophomonas pictorum]KRG41496.1 hypothetical protein ARC78_11155 [Stenotrophomonas pictorum JCM 9942]
MDTPTAPDAGDNPATHDRRRVLRAFNLSLGFVLLLVVMFTVQRSGWDWRPWSVAPLDSHGLLGLLGAPLLHGSIEHLGANAVALLILGTLAGSVYPQATVRALPLLWAGSGLGAWLLGDIGSHHLGASGVTHGLMFLVFVLGLLRRDRPAIAASLIGFLFYGSMLITILPHEPGVSWQSHMGGAAAGVIAALLFRNADPRAPRKRYSWEDEEEEALAEDAVLDHELEQRAPHDVPVLWQPRQGRDYEVVVPLRRRDPDQPPRE